MGRGSSWKGIAIRGKEICLNLRSCYWSIRQLNDYWWYMYLLHRWSLITAIFEIETAVKSFSFYILLGVIAKTCRSFISLVFSIFKMVAIKQTLSLSIPQHQRNLFLILHNSILRNLLFVWFIVFLDADWSERRFNLSRQQSLPLNIL